MESHPFVWLEIVDGGLGIVQAPYYNANHFELHVFQEEGQPVYSKIEDTDVSFPNGYIYWDGIASDGNCLGTGNATPYYYRITLKNCYNYSSTLDQEAPIPLLQNTDLNTQTLLDQDFRWDTLAVVYVFECYQDEPIFVYPNDDDGWKSPGNVGIYSGTDLYPPMNIIRSDIDTSYMADELSAYPNPVSTSINLVWSNELPQEVRITLYDNIGNVVPISWTNLDGNTILIELSQIASGTYLLRLEAPNDTKHITFVKL